MKAETKAEELTSYYNDFLQSEMSCIVYFDVAKQCATKCVDEIINSKPIGDSLEYWENVKIEINKL